MRHFLFALMIVLLPLRGWVGDAMATQMAAGQLQHHQTKAATHAGHGHEAMNAGHSSHVEGTAETPVALHDCAGQVDEGSGHAGDDHCETCAACQACHTVALSPAALDSMPVFSAPTLPHSAADQFASADAALRQKPPIS